MGSLLTVDLGLKTGLALYGRDGRLIWYRSHNFGTTARLKKGVNTLLASIPNLTWLILEGGGTIAEIWLNEARRRGISVHLISAEQWRDLLLYPREQRTRLQAKQSVFKVAKRIIDWSDAPRPTSLRHDTAEAIAIGLWGVLYVGWLQEVPAEVRR